MELSIITKDVPLPITITNFEELKTELAPKLGYYNSLIVTEDTVKDAKTDRARLNALKKAIEDRRKDAKRAVMSVYTPLESQCKELIAMIDAPITAIDMQVRAFESRDEEQKYAELEVFFQAVNTLDWLEIDDVLNPKWKNKGMAVKDLKAEMEAKIGKIEADVEMLEDTLKDSIFRTAVLEHYKQNKDYADSYRYLRQLEQAQAEEQHRTKAENEAKPTGIVGFRVECTAEQLKALRQYMINNGIKYEVIKESEDK